MCVERGKRGGGVCVWGGDERRLRWSVVLFCEE